jgi:hypothetical protein
MAPSALLMERRHEGAHNVRTLPPMGTSRSRPANQFGQQERMITMRSEGKSFLARERMAAIFLRRALDTIAGGGAAVIPLLHSAGLELLLITPMTAVACIYDGRPLSSITRVSRTQARGVQDVEKFTR